MYMTSFIRMLTLMDHIVVILTYQCNMYYSNHGTLCIVYSGYHNACLVGFIHSVSLQEICASALLGMQFANMFLKELLS